MKPHKHAALIHAWAQGAEIEWLCGNEWLPITNPHWHEDRDYRIKPKEPEWYENIPEHGVLCWVKLAGESCNTRKRIASIIEYDAKVSHFYCINGGTWKYATPLTNDEIRQFLRE